MIDSRKGSVRICDATAARQTPMSDTLGLLAFAGCLILHTLKGLPISRPLEQSRSFTLNRLGIAPPLDRWRARTPCRRSAWPAVLGHDVRICPTKDRRRAFQRYPPVVERCDNPLSSLGTIIGSLLTDVLLGFHQAGRTEVEDMHANRNCRRYVRLGIRIAAPTCSDYRFPN